MTSLATPLPSRVSAATANERTTAGQRKALSLEERLARQYESSLRATARRCGDAYVRRTQVLYAAAPPDPSQPPQPTVDEVLNAELAAASATARTQATRRKIAETVAGEVLAGFGPEPGLRPLLEPLVRQQAGVQAERLTAGVRETVASILLDALTEGWSVPETAAQIRSVLTEDAKWRATMLARTDLISLSNGAAHQAAKVLGDAGPQYKTWLTAGDDRVRESHVEADRQTVGIDQPYQVGDSLLQYPGDPAGADGDVINCFPGWTRFSGPDVLAGVRSWYDGDLVRVVTESGYEVSGTPNHPVLTSSGWKRLDLVDESDSLVCGSFGQEEAGVDPDVEDTPPSVEEVFAALQASGAATRVSGSHVDLYGHRPTGKVDVVTANRPLRFALVAASSEPVRELAFASADVASACSVSGSAGSKFLGGALHATDSSVGSAGPGGALFGGGAGHTDGHRLASVARLDPSFEKGLADGAPADSNFDGESAFGLAFHVSAAKVIEVDRVRFRGHVYSFETTQGVYLANGVTASNCRCVSIFSDAPAPTLRHTSDGGIEDGIAVLASAALDELLADEL